MAKLSKFFVGGLLLSPIVITTVSCSNSTSSSNDSKINTKGIVRTIDRDTVREGQVNQIVDNKIFSVVDEKVRQITNNEYIGNNFVELKFNQKTKVNSDFLNLNNLFSYLNSVIHYETFNMISQKLVNILQEENKELYNKLGTIYNTQFSDAKDIKYIENVEENVANQKVDLFYQNGKIVYKIQTDTIFIASSLDQFGNYYKLNKSLEFYIVLPNVDLNLNSKSENFENKIEKNDDENAKYPGLSIEKVEMKEIKSSYTQTEVKIYGSGLAKVDQDDIYLIDANEDNLNLVVNKDTLLKNFVDTNNHTSLPTIRIIQSSDKSITFMVNKLIDFGRYLVGINNSQKQYENFVDKKNGDSLVVPFDKVFENNPGDLTFGYLYYDDLKNNVDIKYNWKQSWEWQENGKKVKRFKLESVNGSDLTKLNIYDLFFYEVIERWEYKIVLNPDGTFSEPVYDPGIVVRLFDENNFKQWDKDNNNKYGIYSYYQFLKEKYGFKIVNQSKNEFVFEMINFNRSYDSIGILCVSAFSNEQFFEKTNYGVDLINEYNKFEDSKAFVEDLFWKADFL